MIQYGYMNNKIKVVLSLLVPIIVFSFFSFDVFNSDSLLYSLDGIFGAGEGLSLIILTVILVITGEVLLSITSISKKAKLISLFIYPIIMLLTFVGIFSLALSSSLSGI